MAASIESLIDQVLADPPDVHLMVDGDDSHLGVWSTERECYRLLLESSGPSSRTLETGSGISTVLFAACRTDHTCITPSDDEAARILGYCADRDIDTGTLRFKIGPSESVLPGLPADRELDIVFIDGNHGYPTPAIDCFYAGSLLRDGGLLVLDDVHLPAVAQLRAFLDSDPRWTNGEHTEKWVSYRRQGSGSLVQDWWQQPFWKPLPVARPRQRLAGKAKSFARRLTTLGRQPPTV